MFTELLEARCQSFDEVVWVLILGELSYGFL
jgi:hypothetical protein